MDPQRPLIAITMGDPAGIGPEIVVKALADGDLQALCRPLVVGSPAILKEAARFVQQPLALRETSSPEGVVGEPGRLAVLSSGGVSPDQVPLGQATEQAGHASMQAVLKALELVHSGAASALVTAPINKEAWHLAGFHDIGHQEVLKRLSGSSQVATMLVSGPLRCVHLTTHLPLRQACDAVRRDAILDRIRLTHRFFQDWGFDRPRIAVAALNPHASDGGLLGAEEREHIAPAVRDAQEEGVLADGPVPADIVFHQAINGRYDAVLAMYHDQGHIPVKVYGFEQSVSVNLGLPFIRTSVDHGTAFDIAGLGVADHRSMREAIKLAVSLVTRRRLT